MFAVGNTTNLRAIPRAASLPAPSGKMFLKISSAPSALWARKSSPPKNKTPKAVLSTAFLHTEKQISLM